jgi:hypothetical protein
MIAYSFNKAVFTKIQTYILDANIIQILDSSNHVIDTVKTDAIISISLVHTPIKTAKKLHQCTIQTIDNREIILRNYSYIGIVNFKNQTDAYLKFLDHLHEKTKNKSVLFKKGIHKVSFLLLIGFMLLMTALMGVIVYVLYNKGKYGEMTISGIALVLFVFLTITSIARFKPKKYDPNNIPNYLLPI